MLRGQCEVLRGQCEVLRGECEVLRGEVLKEGNDSELQIQYDQLATSGKKQLHVAFQHCTFFFSTFFKVNIFFSTFFSKNVF